MPLVPSTHGDRCRKEAEPARERVHLRVVCDERRWKEMSANYEARAEAEAAMLLAKLSEDMEHAAIRLPVLLAHAESAVRNAEELRGAAACVKQWAERLRA